MNKELIVIGDRVLILPDKDQTKTSSGLYLPQGVQEKEKAQTGTIVKTGPGYPIPDPSSMENEPWKTAKTDTRYFPLQVQEGDYCIFLRSSGVEIEFDNVKYIVVPHSAVLVVLRR